MYFPNIKTWDAESTSWDHHLQLLDKSMLIVLSFPGPFQNFLLFLQESSYKERRGMLLYSPTNTICRERTAFPDTSVS